ncbi:MAG: hypothetical protein IT582_07700 [Opitutaceae bacterium]|nr:hypothetical protein [Opitutaceae bacterium]
MNKTATVSLLAASALLFVPKPAAAGDKEIAAIGGFIGGLILGSQIDHDHHRGHVVVAPSCPPSPQIVIQAGGFWDYRPVRVWVAPRWTVVYDHCNRPVRRYIAGHYDTRHERVWVARNGGHGSYAHYDRPEDGRGSSRHYHGDRRRDRHDRRDRR